jgi:hypothetical protein
VYREKESRYPLSLQQGEVAKANARSDGERLHKQHEPYILLSWSPFWSPSYLARVSVTVTGEPISIYVLA